MNSALQQPVEDSEWMRLTYNGSYLMTAPNTKITFVIKTHRVDA